MSCDHDWWPAWTYQEKYSRDETLYEGDVCAVCGVVRMKCDGVVNCYNVGKEIYEREPACQHANVVAKCG